MSPTSYQAALPRVIPSLLSATLIIIPYSNGFVNRVRKVFLQRKQRMKTRLLTFFPESQQARQFTPLREGRQSANVSVQVINQFQFTPLREGRQPRNRQARCSAHFNSRSSARGDLSEYRVRRILIISIHAPPRGATMPSPSVTASTNFNSRPSARGDPHGTNLPNSFFISIHAPPRGATHFVSSYGSVLQFQFTPLREGRPADKANHNLPALFQFTPLREGRHAK